MEAGCLVALGGGKGQRRRAWRDEAARIDLEVRPEDVDYFYFVGDRRSGHFWEGGGGW